MKQGRERTTRITMPESMRNAAQALKRIAAGEPRTADLAEVMLAINEAPVEWGGIIAAREIDNAIRELRDAVRRAEDLDERVDLRDQAEALELRYEAVSRG